MFQLKSHSFLYEEGRADLEHGSLHSRDSRSQSEEEEEEEEPKMNLPAAGLAYAEMHQIIWKSSDLKTLCLQTLGGDCPHIIHRGLLGSFHRRDC